MIKNMTVEQASKLKIKPNIVTGEWEVECFVEDLADFLKVRVIYYFKMQINLINKRM